MINYTLTVTNTDDDPALNVVVASTDPTVIVSGAGVLGSLNPGQTATATATKVITPAMEGTTDVVTFTATGIIDGETDMASVTIPVVVPPASTGPVAFTESRLQGTGSGQATGTLITQPVFTPDRQMEIRTVQLSVAGGIFSTTIDTTLQMRQGANANGPVLATSDTLVLAGGIGPRVFTFPAGVVVPAGVPVTFTVTNPSPSQQWEIDPIGSDFYTDTNLLESTSGLTDRGAPIEITGFEV